MAKAQVNTIALTNSTNITLRVFVFICPYHILSLPLSISKNIFISQILALKSPIFVKEGLLPFSPNRICPPTAKGYMTIAHSIRLTCSRRCFFLISFLFFSFFLFLFSDGVNLAGFFFSFFLFSLFAIIFILFHSYFYRPSRAFNWSKLSSVFWLVFNMQSGSPISKSFT